MSYLGNPYSPSNIDPAVLATKMDKVGGTFTGPVNFGAQQMYNGYLLTGGSVVLVDNTDTTKRANINLAGISTSTTRTITFPDRNIDFGNLMVMSAVIPTTSGTSIDITSIPSWVKRISIFFNNISLSGSSYPTLQLGTSGGIQTTGYDSYSGYIQQSNLAGVGNYVTGAGFAVPSSGAVFNFKGVAVLNLANASTGQWFCTINGQTGNASPPFLNFVNGDKTLSGTLDRVRLMSSNGTDTFDAGSITVMWE